MSFTFTPEQDELRAGVRTFFTDRSSSADVRRQIDSETGYDGDVWAQLVGQLGLTGVGIPEEFGGHGYGSVEIGIVLDEAGRALLCSPYFASVALAGQALVATSDDEAKKRWLPAIAAGELTATLAIAESPRSWDLAAPVVRARRQADGWLLDGGKTFVVDGNTAELVLVTAATEDGPGLFAVTGDGGGVTRARLDALDLTRRLAEITFGGTPALRLRLGPDAVGTLRRIGDLVSTAVAIEQVGGAQRCLDMAVEYAKVRVQFGRPIGSFQAIKHKCADMLIDVESARSAAYYALSVAADGPAEELPLAAAIAKAVCCDAYVHAAKENIQVHGGIGFTWEHDAHLYLRRAKSMQLLFGTPDAHRARLADLVGI